MKKLLLVCVCAAAAVLCGCMSKTEIAERYLQQGEFEKALFLCFFLIAHSSFIQ